MENLIDKCGSAQWRKSSYSGHDGSNCVEVARLAGGQRGVRDSKDHARPPLIVGSVEWAAFLDDVKLQRLG